RDAQVLPIWEGTTNILSLDLLRVLIRKQGHLRLFARVDLALIRGRANDPELAAGVDRQRSALASALARLVKRSPEQQQREVRGLVEGLWRLYCSALLLEGASHPGLREPFLAALQRILARPHVVAPAGAFAEAAGSGSEEPLLRAGFWPRDGSQV
ncbi:MAG TPA: hypothetical protein ENJ18_17905, partial [Nannocystis exedens]|nr:hypothetical protein [Nannocystis exedens]